MLDSSSARRWPRDLLTSAERWLEALGPLVRAADPEGSLDPRGRRAVAGMGMLAQLTHAALGGAAQADAVGEAGAMLALLLAIDARALALPRFHDAAGEDRDALRSQARAHLAPTLASLTSGHAVNDEGRCALAAALGRALRALAGDDARLDRLHGTLAAVWDREAEAITVVTRHPSTVSRSEIDAVTGALGGLRLLAHAQLGALPPDGQRDLRADEEESLLAWGAAMERTRALAELDLDVADGHLATYPGRLLWERAPGEALDALSEADFRTLYALVSEHEIDRDCLLDDEDVALFAKGLRLLGEVPALLAWVQGALTDHYFAHPLSITTGSFPFRPRLVSGRLGAPVRGSARPSAA